MSTEETAECRHCGMQLIGKPYWMGQRQMESVLHPITRERIKSNYFGGYVCSKWCDYRASLTQEQSMPGHGYSQQSLGQEARSHYENNWNE